MTELVKDNIFPVWLGLVAATTLSYWMGTDHGIDNADLVTSLIIIVAFIKIRFVGLYFMELKGAPLALRGIFEGYATVVPVALIICYFAM